MEANARTVRLIFCLTLLSLNMFAPLAVLSVTLMFLFFLYKTYQSYRRQIVVLETLGPAMRANWPSRKDIFLNAIRLTIADIIPTSVLARLLTRVQKSKEKKC